MSAVASAAIVVALHMPLVVLCCPVPSLLLVGFVLSVTVAACLCAESAASRFRLPLVYQQAYASPELALSLPVLLLLLVTCSIRRAGLPDLSTLPSERGVGASPKAASPKASRATKQ